jgi:Uma2 family endonuclease
MTAVLELLDGATRHKLTVDDYYRMAEVGILKREDQVELIEGLIIDMHLPSGVARHKLTVDDYYRMAETGVLKPGERVELIDGEIIDMAPIGSEHAGKTNRLIEVFAKAIAERLCLISVQNPLRLDTRSEPQPDLMLLRLREDRYSDNHPTAADVLLLVEVSDSSLAYDRGAKLALYARHKIPEVWIVNIQTRSLEIYRHPKDTGFDSKDDLKKGTITPELLPGLTVNLEELLG